MKQRLRTLLPDLLPAVIIFPLLAFGVGSALSGEPTGAAPQPANLADLVSKLAAPEQPVRDAALAALKEAGPAAVDALIAGLASEDLSQRFYAAKALGELGDARAIDPLAALLNDPNPFVRREAVTALGKTKDRRAMPHLMKAVKDSDEQVRKLASDAMTEIKDAYFAEVPEETSDDARKVEALATALNDASPVMRKQAALQLGEIKDDRAAELLVGALNDPDMWVSLQAGDSLRALQSQRAGELIAEVLLDGGDEKRMSAAKALRLDDEVPSLAALAEQLRAGGDGPVAPKITGEDGADVLIGLVRSDDPTVRRGAVIVMGLLRGSWPTETFIKSLGDENTMVRLSASLSLTDRAEGALEPLLEALKDPDPGIRRGAVRTLGIMKQPEAFDALIGALKDEAPHVRRAALESLRSKRDPRAVLPICELLKDPSPENRQLAADVLGRLRDLRAAQPLIGTLRDAETSVVEEGIGALGMLN